MEFFTYKELAERWKLSEKTISRKVRAGRLKPSRLSDRAVRFRLDEVERYERSITSFRKTA